MTWSRRTKKIRFTPNVHTRMRSWFGSEQTAIGPHVSGRYIHVRVQKVHCASGYCAPYVRVWVAYAQDVYERRKLFCSVAYDRVTFSFRTNPIWWAVNAARAPDDGVEKIVTNDRIHNKNPYREGTRVVSVLSDMARSR